MNVVNKGLGFLAGLSLMTASSMAANSFLAPFRVEVSGKPIDVDVGHAAPLLVDFDGDGLKDLLVGQFGDGKLRIYKNEGSATAPKFSSFAWFKAGTGDGKVPAG
jgi:hypothetical protein